MSNNRFVNTGGGNYNESIQGNYVQGNYIDNSSNVNQLLEIVTSVEQDLKRLKDQGYSAILRTKFEQVLSLKP